MTQDQPVYLAFAVEDAPRGNKSYWTRVGRLFPHKDGKGWDLPLAAFPVDGKVVIRLDEPKEETPPAPAAE